MVLNYIYGIVMINLLAVNLFLSVDLSNLNSGKSEKLWVTDWVSF